MPALLLPRLTIPTAQGAAWVDIDRPTSAPTSLLVLGHGAGGGVDAPDLLAVTRAAVVAGVVVARVTQPYRVAGKRAPVTAPRLDAAWSEIVAAMSLRPELARLPQIFGGRSSGARVACRTAATLNPAAVIALAFPAHPPGKPEKTRLDELDLPQMPTLVVQGSRDSFGIPPDAAASGRVRRLVIVPGADHSLKRDTSAVASAVLSFLSDLGLARASG